jgi:hypothetical protein
MPALCGFGAVTANKGVCVLALVGGAGQTVSQAVADGKTVSLPAGFSPVLNGVVTGTVSVYFPLVEGTHYPPNAKALIVAFSCVTSGASSPQVVITPQIQVVSGSGGYVFWSTPNFGGGESPYAFSVLTIAGPTFGQVMRIPVIPKYPSDISGSTQVQIIWNPTVFAGSWAVGDTKMVVVGYEL